MCDWKENIDLFIVSQNLTSNADEVPLQGLGSHLGYFLLGGR